MSADSRTSYRYALYKRLRTDDPYGPWVNRHLRMWAVENGVPPKSPYEHRLTQAVGTSADNQMQWWRMKLGTQEGQAEFDAWLKRRYEGKKKMKPHTIHELQGFTPLKLMVDLSTGHMPGPNPDFGVLRFTEDDEIGFTVYVHGAEPGDPNANDGVPEWLLPIVEYAQKHGAFLINFDRDGDTYDMFQTWEW